MTLRHLHRYSAVLLGLFLLAHLANHLAGLAGIDAHIAVMEGLRTVYRFPLVEGLLLVAVGVQVVSGITFLARDWKKRRGTVYVLQAVSGGYLAFFFLNHVGAVLFGRTVLDLDTTFHFAAAGMHVAPFHFFFMPYYFLSVLALFTHAGCFFYWRRLRASPTGARIVLAVSMATGAVLGLLIVLMLAGALYPVDIPAEYRALYESLAYPEAAEQP